MKIKVDPKVKWFHVDGVDKWIKVGGHGVTIGKYEFCFIPVSSGLKIAEVTTGNIIHSIDYSAGVLIMTESKEDALYYFREKAEIIKTAIERQKDFAERLRINQKEVTKRLGKKPETETADERMFFAKESDMKH